MNMINIKGYVRDLKYSHRIKNTEYYKCSLLSRRENGLEDVIELKFKKDYCNFKDGDLIEVTGNVRSYSHLVNGKNKVDIYVFTNSDMPQAIVQAEGDSWNKVEITGRICKTNPLRELKNNKCNIYFTLANNITAEEKNIKLNSYIPIIAWNNLARKISGFKVGDLIKITGELHSREYKKLINPETEEFEIRIAHELLAFDAEIIDNEI